MLCQLHTRAPSQLECHPSRGIQHHGFVALRFQSGSMRSEVAERESSPHGGGSGQGKGGASSDTSGPKLLARLGNLQAFHRLQRASLVVSQEPLGRGPTRSNGVEGERGSTAVAILDELSLTTQQEPSLGEGVIGEILFQKPRDHGEILERDSRCTNSFVGSLSLLKGGRVCGKDIIE